MGIEFFIYFFIIIIASAIIYSIIEYFSVDRVLKIIRNKKAFVVIDNKWFFGKIIVPPRSGGGFEILYEKIHEPEFSFYFLYKIFKETSEKKFLKKIEKLKRKIKFSKEKIDESPWLKPTLSSKKVFKNEISNLKAIFVFKDYLSKKEVEKRKKELASLFHPSFIKRVKRKLSNMLSFVRDKLTSSVSQFSAITPIPKEFRKFVEEPIKKTIQQKFSSYEPLLENSIGKLVAIEVLDVDGNKKMYVGILREYSENYLMVYDVRYSFPLICEFKDGKTIFKPKNLEKVFGTELIINEHLKIEQLKEKIEIRNVFKKPLKILKIKGEKEIKVDKILKPGESIFIEKMKEFSVEYEIKKIVDVIWPRNLAIVVGSSELHKNF